MKTFGKLTAATAFAALLGAGLSAVPHEAFAQAKNPCAHKAANPCAAKAANPCAAKAANPCAAKTGGSGGKFSYDRFNPNYLKGTGSN